MQCFWTVSSYKGCLHFSDITPPWGLGCGKNVGLQDLEDFEFVATGGASMLQKHILSAIDLITCYDDLHVEISY